MFHKTVLTLTSIAEKAYKEFKAIDTHHDN